MTPRTYTYSWTQTRLETIQDQFSYLLNYGGFSDDSVDRVIDAVGEKAVCAAGIFGCDFTGLRVIEVELRINWELSNKLTLTIPTIAGGLSGWDGRQTPEIKVAGRRFANAAEKLTLDTNYWVALSSDIRSDPVSYGYWRGKLHLSGKPPEWKSGPHEKDDGIIDLPEGSVYTRTWAY